MRALVYLTCMVTLVKRPLTSASHRWPLVVSVNKQTIILERYSLPTNTAEENRTNFTCNCGTGSNWCQKDATARVEAWNKYSVQYPMPTSLGMGPGRKPVWTNHPRAWENDVQMDQSTCVNLPWIPCTQGL
jgi:hypothetical protein